MKRRANIATRCALLAALALAGCGAGSVADGAPFAAPADVATAAFDPAAASGQNGGAIDVSHAVEGYVGAAAVSTARLKLQVTAGQMSYNYDLPQDGTPIVVPLNMGSGLYTVRIMRNTSQSNYVETARTQVDAQLASEFAPFLVPTVYCSYTPQSACVQKARELVVDAATQGEALERICTYVVDNVRYDTQKAQELSGTSGYVPNPDDTLATQSGICFDYASLSAAMLRSLGIPAKIVTGYVSPQNVYHAWTMVYIDGTWKTARFEVNRNTWSRVDLTFAATQDNPALVGDGKEYTDRYVY